MITRLWAWLVGYVVIKLKGAQLEALVNRIAGGGYGIWDLERVTANIMIGKIRIKHFKKLRPLLSGLNVRVGIVGRAGLPFFAAKVSRRKGLVVGLALLAVLFYHLAGFVWMIEIAGGEQISAAAISDLLAREGVRVGAPKSQIDLNYLENLLLISFPELSWVGARIKGVLMQIEVAERASPHRAEVQYGDVVAAQNGLITQVVPFRGTPLVTVGSTVKKGDILISGEYYDQYGRRQQGSAEGIVRARVWYDAFGEAAFSKITAIETGNYHTSYSVAIGKWVLRLGRPAPFANHASEAHTWQPRIGGLKLPFAVTKHIYAEVDYQTTSIAVDQARALALERAWQQLAASGVDRDQVKDTQVTEHYLMDQDGIRVGVIVELEQDIAEFAPRL